MGISTASGLDYQLPCWAGVSVSTKLMGMRALSAWDQAVLLIHLLLRNLWPCIAAHFLENLCWGILQCWRGRARHDVRALLTVELRFIAFVILENAISWCLLVGSSFNLTGLKFQSCFFCLSSPHYILITRKPIIIARIWLHWATTGLRLCFSGWFFALFFFKMT